MDKKLCESTNLCVEIMNNKRQVMGKLAWSRGTNWHTRDATDTVTTNGEGQILFENSQNKKWSDKNSPKQFLWIKLGMALLACIFKEE